MSDPDNTAASQSSNSRALGPDAWRLGYFDPGEQVEYRLMQSNYTRFKEFEERNRNRSGNPYYITAVPKTLDLLEYCLKFVSPEVNVSLIMNGLAPWEQAHIERKYPSLPSFALETVGKSILYDRVLDMLTEGSDARFGVLDQDCFVLDRSFFDRLRVGENEFAAAPFVTFNRLAGMEFPRTYFLLLNASVVKSIREKYQLSFKRCWEIPKHLDGALEHIHLGYANFPHTTLNYFDNFQLIWAMALHDRVPFRRVRTTRRLGRLLKRWRYRVVHVGAGHNYLTEEYRDAMPGDLRRYDDLPQLDRERLHAAAFCHYAHLRLLESSADEELREHYLPFFSVYGGSGGLLRQFGALIGAARIEQMNLVIREARRER